MEYEGIGRRKGIPKKPIEHTYICDFCSFRWVATRGNDLNLCTYCLSSYRLLERYKGDIASFKADRLGIKLRTEKIQNKTKKKEKNVEF